MKLKKKDKEIINFFKLVGVYDEDAFNYIYNHKEDIKNKSEYIYLDLDYLKDNKLLGFKVNSTVIKNNSDMLKNIYLYAKAINLYHMLNKVYEEKITDEVLPLSLIGLYAELYLGKNFKRNLLKNEYNKLFNADEKFLLAYDLQFNIIDDYIKSGVLLIPDSFYIDDLNALKESCLSKKNF